MSTEITIRFDKGVEIDITCDTPNNLAALVSQMGSEVMEEAIINSAAQTLDENQFVEFMTSLNILCAVGPLIKPSELFSGEN